jgi:hypothetical protein
MAVQIDREIKPLLTNLNAVGGEAARAAALATAQVERVDRLFADVSVRIEESVAAVQSALIAPAREGLALISGVRAALGALKSMRQATSPSHHPHPDDDDPLFIG